MWEAEFGRCDRESCRHSMRFLRMQFVAEVFEQSSGSGFDMCTRGLLTRDTETGTPMRLLDSFRAQCGDPTSLVLSVTCN